MKKVSVVIPCYNVASYLDCCMEHILKQTIGIENIEIILVDDASTDNGATWGLIMEYEKRFPEQIIAIPLQQNLRQGGARNVGISYAGGEYLMFCDADDWLALEAMEVLYQTAKKQDADVVEYRMKIVMDHSDLQGQIEWGKGSYQREMGDDANRRKLLMLSTEDFSLGCMRKFYRLSLIQDNHICFAEHLICEEPSFTLLVRLYEKKHIFLDAVLYFYFQSPNSTTRGNWDKRKLDNAKVWLLLIGELEKRGFLQRYDKELECMFFDWGFRMSIRMILGRGYIVTKEEMGFLKNMVLHLFPNILKNPYICRRSDSWNTILKAALAMEASEENVLGLNQIMNLVLAQPRDDY